jgi:opacity protein-like surface antigen
MKIQLLGAAVLAALSTGVQAQDVYAGIGLPGLYTLGYAHPLSRSLGLRVDYADGLSVSKDGNQDGVNVTGTFKANRLGAFADWYPFGGGFRLVGGVTANDIKADFVGVGTGSSTINGKPVNLSGETFNVAVKFPTATPYLGIGYGHQLSEAKGLGFYADLGVMVGTFTADTTTTMVGKQGITQADVDAQTQKIRDSLNGYSVLPSASLGLLYRY